ncbi:MAG: uroporphyrinogen-III synthase [Elusimicrobia bacterium]|nr:uroporphyrinogen-III synthase [Elusimicrobiota bacterium]
MSCKPLMGRTILVTRPEGPAGPLADGLRALGARVWSVPVIRFAPPASWTRLDAALRDLGRYDAAVFASARAVESTFARARALGLRLSPPPKVFAVGPATAGALRRRGWRAVAPRRHRAEDLAAVAGRVRGQRIFLPRAQAGREVLPRLLRAQGAKVDAVAAYRTLADRRGARRLRAAAASGGVDAVVFTSGSAVENLLRQLPAASRRRLFNRAVAASIGPVTSAALEQRGVSAAVEAPRATVASLCGALARHFRAR